MPSLDLFEAEYVIAPHDAQHSCSVVRSALLHVFRGKRRVALSEVLRRFEEVMSSVRLAGLVDWGERNTARTVIDSLAALIVCVVLAILVHAALLPPAGTTLQSKAQTHQCAP